MRIFLFIIGLCSIAGAIAILATWTKKDIQSQKLMESKAPKASACDLPLQKDVIFNGIWIGMHRNDYKHRSNSIEYSPETYNKGTIEWDPIWKNDTLVALRLIFNSNWSRTGNTETARIMSSGLSRASFKAMFDKRIQFCEAEIDNEAIIPKHELICGRISITHYLDEAFIYITDLCHEEIEAAAKATRDSIEIKKSKSLFE